MRPPDWAPEAIQAPDTLPVDGPAASARFAPIDLTRPRPRWIDVTTRLMDFAIITYAVEPEALAGHLPPGFAPDVRALAGGRRCALVSAVPFRDRDFRFGAVPWLRFSMGQTNYRAYVLHRGRPCVWFFGTCLTRPYVYAPILWWKLPWYAAAMQFDTRWEGDLCRSYRLRTQSRWGAAEVELEGTDRPMGCLDGFGDEEETAVILTHPLTGYYYRRDGKVGSYAIWHDRLNLHRARPLHTHFQVFEDLGLVRPGAVPHSVLVQREAEFVIRLPPRAVQP